MILEFFAGGQARPKGSKRLVRTKGGRTLLLEDSAREKPWRAGVSNAALMAMRGSQRFLDTPLAVTMVFGFARPKAHYLRSGLRSDAPTYHVGKPDGSKLARSVEDALNGIVWDDDSRIAQLVACKIYVDRDEPIGVALRATALPRAMYLSAPSQLEEFYRHVAGVGLAALAREAAHVAP